MPFCPNCRYEYENEIAVCPDCGAPLVSELPALQDVPGENRFELLLKADEQEALAVEAFLKSEGFHVLRLLANEGSVMRMYAGRSCFGAELYVPKEELSDAKEAVSAFFRVPSWSEVDVGEPQTAEAEQPGGTEEFQKLQRLMRTFLRIVAVLLMIFYGIRFFLSR